MSRFASSSPGPQSLTPDVVVRQLRHLSAAPRVLPRLKQLLNDGNSSMTEVVELIQLDPGIAAHVLHMGNSAFYSQGTKCFTVDEAICRVGYNQVYQLVAHAVASQVIVRPLAVYELEADEMWRCSVACALGAEILARTVGTDTDIAYTLGLLHGVGMVALDEWAFRFEPALRLPTRGWPREASDAEIARFGFHQAEAGAALLRSWNFPHGMCEAVRWQYLPGATAAHFHLACLVYAAKWLRWAACAAAQPPHPPETRVLDALHLTPARLEEFAAEVRDRLATVIALLDTGMLEKESVRFPSQVRAVSTAHVER
jgi:HD-like signal output (HDOD) protein